MQAATAPNTASNRRVPIWVAVAICLTMWGGWFGWYRYVTRTAPHVRKYADGVVAERGTLLRQPGGFLSPTYKAHGAWETYDPRGRRLTRTEFDNGERHGRRQEWDADGQLLAEEQWEHDLLKSRTVASQPSAANTDGAPPPDSGAGR